jgi:hypothetical protein
VSDPRLLPLAGWDNFYVIIGSAAAALTGLQFVVTALIGDGSRKTAARDALDAFGTPTVVHFCFVLLMAATLTAPWPSLSVVSDAVGACGIGGVGYTAIVMRRARKQSTYAPVLEDWIWHVMLPLVAYLIVAVSAAELRRHERDALFGVAGGALLLLFIGIHNAWDSAVFIALGEDNPKE